MSGSGETPGTVEAVYAYYGRLFLDHPYLEWAGLAGMIGPAFYAGFRDLGLLPDAVRAAVIAVLGRARRGGSPAALRGDLGFYETTFLTMRKKIFEDLAGMHEAYLAGGLAQIEELYLASLMATGRCCSVNNTTSSTGFTSACSGTGGRWARPSRIC